MRCFIDIGSEDNLRNAVSVAQVDENGAAVIPAIVDPSHQHNIRSNVLGSEFAAGVGASPIEKAVSRLFGL